MRSVFLGVACPSAGNFVGCDRVCLFVRLAESDPDYLLATLAGHDVRLPNGRGRIYEACLRRDGLLHRGPLEVRANANEHWFGSPPVSVPITLQAVFGDQGRYVERKLPSVRLSAGYG